MPPQELKAMFDKGSNNLKQSANKAISEINENIDALNDMVTQETGTSQVKVMSQKAVTDAISGIMLESGAGDMAKSVYDKNSSGIVDNSETLEGKTLQDIMLLMNPVGTIKMTTTNINPESYIGGTWERWGEGRFPLGLGMPKQNTLTSFGTLTEEELSLNFLTCEGTSGTYRHTLTVSQMPAHSHTTENCPGHEAGNAWVGGSGTATPTARVSSTAGGGAAHNNMPPYITCYMWKRTA